MHKCFPQIKIRIITARGEARSDADIINSEMDQIVACNTQHCAVGKNTKHQITTQVDTSAKRILCPTILSLTLTMLNVSCFKINVILTYFYI